MSVTLLATKQMTVHSVQRREVEKDVVEEKVVAAEEITVAEKAVEVEETTVAKAVGSLKVVREDTILTTHVYVIVVVKRAIKLKTVRMLKNLRRC